MRTIETDYLVIGAGAMGMAFTDALIDHADVHVTIVDRRIRPGGHWHDAYPFVRLHQASTFYGVASTLLGSSAVQLHGPEAGLHERAGLSEIAAYYDGVMNRRLLPSGKVSFQPASDHGVEGDDHVITSRVSGERVRVVVRSRVVDASYLSPAVPSTSPPPFGVADGVRVATVNDLATLDRSPSEFVIVGSGKTATDAIVFLLGNGVDPGRIVWVRPRDPWMLNRAAVQPDPAVMIRMSADLFAAAADAESLDAMFLGLEAAGVMLRIDPDVVPTMAKGPTLAVWELELLRTIENVVRMGHVHHVQPGALAMERGTVSIAPDALIVHCAASGLRRPPLVPIWQPDRIRLQTIRAGVPCFAAALAGLVEATRDDDRERNRLCPPNAFGNSRGDWARMQARGARAAAVFGAESDIAAWAGQCALSPSRTLPAQRNDPAVRAATARLAEHAEQGLTRLVALAEDEPN